MSQECYYPFDKFVVEYQFNFKMVSKTPISIGGGNNILGIDNAIVRLNNKPYIPGSSLKGILRTYAEKLIRALYGEDETLVCNILADTERKRKENMEKEKKDHEYKPCITCEIFGGPTIASRIKVHNAMIVDDAKKLTETVRRVTIDRVSGAQSKGRLFDVEYLLPEIEMDWSLSFENIELLKDINEVGERSKRILTVINNLISTILTQGIEVGGKRSIGYGQLKVKELVKVIEYRVNREQILLEGRDVTQEYIRRIGV